MLITLPVRLWSLLVTAGLLLTILNIDYGGRVEIFMKMTYSYILKGGGGIFTAQKLAGNHSKRGEVNVQQAFIPIHPQPIPFPLPFPNHFAP